MRFAPGTILVFDRGYMDYQWYAELTRQGVFFVTRLRHDAHYPVLEEGAPCPSTALSSATSSSGWAATGTARNSLCASSRLGSRSGRSPWCSSPTTSSLAPLRSPASIESAGRSRPETELAGQKLRRHQRQCPEDPDLDRPDRHAAPPLSSVAGFLWLVLVQSGRSAPPTTLRLPRPVRLARSTVSTPASSPRSTSSPTGAHAGLKALIIWTATVIQKLPTCFSRPRSGPSKPSSSNTTGPGPPLIWTALPFRAACRAKSQALLVTLLHEEGELQRCQVPGFRFQSERGGERVR